MAASVNWTITSTIWLLNSMVEAQFEDNNGYQQMDSDLTLLIALDGWIGSCFECEFTRAIRRLKKGERQLESFNI
jgi:hypothetical protein